MNKLSGGLRRALALFCAVVTLFTSVGITSVSAEPANIETAYIAFEGKKTSSIVLPEDGKLQLQVAGVTGEALYSWQIANPNKDDQWVTISGVEGENLWVSYALVGNMLKTNGTAKLRCRLTQDKLTVYTDPVKITVSFNVAEEYHGSEAAPASAPKTNVTKPEATKPEATKPASVLDEGKVQAIAAYALNGALTVAEEDDELPTYSIVINYIYENGEPAFEPYGATVAEGSDFEAIVPSPNIVGYKPMLEMDDGSEPVPADEVVLNLTNITDNKTINVIYKPAMVKFVVRHFLQGLEEYNYPEEFMVSTEGYALTGSEVPGNLAMDMDGFVALSYVKSAVAADGSTVIDIYYDRKYYLIDFDMNGGYGVEPVYVRFGTTVTANPPTRHGYVFDGWELVAYGNAAPNADQKEKFNINTAAIETPAANLRYRAVWRTVQTTYTMVFWKENADDNGYSYWGSIEGISAYSGDLVSAQQWDAVRNKGEVVDAISDQEHFEYNALRSDKDVLVEGDGSTIVNVYYTRKYYKITFVAKGICGITEENHKHDKNCYDLICGKSEHTHGNDCKRVLSCKTPVHTEHTDACITCGMVEHIHGSVDCECKIQEHTHTKDCWDNVEGKQNSAPYNAPSTPETGQIYKIGNNSTYIYIVDSWYKYNKDAARQVKNGQVLDADKCQETEHTHGQGSCPCKLSAHAHDESCYRNDIHEHVDSCYSYTCGEAEHTHSDLTGKCYRLKCGMTEGHTHNADCRNAQRSSTVKIGYYKFEESLKDEWPVVDGAGNKYDSGERWKPGNSSTYSQVLVYIAQMPGEDFTLTHDEITDRDLYTIHYYLESLPDQDLSAEQGEPPRTEDGKVFAWSHTTKALYSHLTYVEDFFEITGFERYKSTPKSFGSGANGTLDTNGGDVYLFYTREVDAKLRFSSKGQILEDETKTGIMYEAPLKDYYFEPEYPQDEEENAVYFEGWYTTSRCYEGTKVDWETYTMPAGGVTLFAKWSPTEHTVRVFKDDEFTEQIGEDQLVPHKNVAVEPSAISNGIYAFQGWFYKDTNGDEKAFVFSGIPIIRDMDIYAKWSSHVLVDYRIEFRLKDSDTAIAEPITGQVLAGQSKTFDAKTGTQLYADYQQGYYPLTNSHTIVMKVENENTFVFEYVQKENVPYEVRYVNSAGEEVFPTKRVEDNKLSVVTETFQRKDKMMPDAYQKRLILVAEGTDADGNGILDENVIEFVYTPDEEHAYYRVVHYVQNLDGEEYREYRSNENRGVIGETYKFEALTISGFDYNSSMTKVNEKPYGVGGTQVSQELSGDGLLVEFYYDRKIVEYTVHYLDYETNEKVFQTETGSGLYGQDVQVTAENLMEEGYSLVSAVTKSITLSANSEKNVIEFFYQEHTAGIRYQIVGPEDGAILSRTSENVKAITGTAVGSTLTVKEGFVFEGWFLDETCENPVPETWFDKETGVFMPEKTGKAWTNVTYYAKIYALETNLTIQVQNAYERDDQSFIFRVQGTAETETEGIDLTVVVVKNAEDGTLQTTIAKLPVGLYTITELTAWAWRYENENFTQPLQLEYSEEGTTVVYEVNRKNVTWLDGNDANFNLFAPPVTGE